MEHVRGAAYHPQTQGKIERWHQTLKNRILLDNYYLPGDLERKIDAFVAHYNHVRYHESIDNLTPADVYFGRAETIPAERQRIKRVTIANRHLQHQLQAAQTLTTDEPARWGIRLEPHLWRKCMEVLRFELMIERGLLSSHKHQGRKRSMKHYAGLDLSIKETSVCIVDQK